MQSRRMSNLFLGQILGLGREGKMDIPQNDNDRDSGMKLVYGLSIVVAILMAVVSIAGLACIYGTCPTRKAGRVALLAGSVILCPVQLSHLHLGHALQWDLPGIPGSGWNEFVGNHCPH
jgi:hypothetical protein